ncbi:MAG: glycosyltransferase family A protein [Hyphomicrobiaceae bacterium]|nr:glycosyltransferase family A protein [Hyphomicrobiaceae bacterium]
MSATLQPIRSAALLVCTYRRPQTFAQLMASVRELDVPEGVRLEICVADNNAESAWDSYVRAAVDGLPWPVHYGHEPVAGYSSARNTAIELALATSAEAFLFTDDDMILDRGWLAGHLRSLDELGADVVNGRIHGVRERFEHGAALEKCGAGNVSFRRRLIAADGLGLRFDPAFNKLGMEDQAFFREATRRGADIRQSDWPRLYNYYGDDGVPEAEVINKMHTTAAMQHNEVALARRDRGFVPAALMASKGVLFGLKGAGLMVESRLWSALGKADKARKAELSSQKETLKMRGRFAGLSGEIVSRQDVRRSDPGASADMAQNKDGDRR